MRALPCSASTRAARGRVDSSEMFECGRNACTFVFCVCMYMSNENILSVCIYPFISKVFPCVATIGAAVYRQRAELVFFRVGRNLASRDFDDWSAERREKAAELGMEGRRGLGDKLNYR